MSVKCIPGTTHCRADCFQINNPYVMKLSIVDNEVILSVNIIKISHLE